MMESKLLGQVDNVVINVVDQIFDENSVTKIIDPELETILEQQRRVLEPHKFFIILTAIAIIILQAWVRGTPFGPPTIFDCT